ncbi:hypothetical protein SAMN02745116_01402 [Pilibacter termitis]|uniref:Uncharacterized protein n=1 Tax=Pilibacter termitis TaxID=263852 RepID=A0A1T4NED7_9ENTE|nr:hypothetical protein [Pilibacter termitis]SJZ77594.1 hypothetical protein SAMN02745116_01402 [Pilibacter termitis]
MANTFVKLDLVETNKTLGKVMVIECHGRTRLKGFGDQEFTHYECVSEKTAIVDLYVPNAKKAVPTEFMDIIIAKGLRVVPFTYRIGQNGQVGTVLLADSVEIDKNAPKEFLESTPEVQKVVGATQETLSYLGKVADYEKTYGELLFMSAIPEYLVVNNQRTNDISHYRVTVISSEQKTKLTVNCLDTELDYTQFSRLKSKVTFENMRPTAIYDDNSSVERGGVEIAYTSDSVKLATSFVSSTPTQLKASAQNQEKK